MAVQIIFLIEVLVAAFVLWLGIYIITRDLPWIHESARPWLRAPLLAGSGLALASVYLYGSAMETVTLLPGEFLRWQQLTLWGIPIAIVCFFWAVVLLTCSGRETPAWTRALLPITVSIAVLLAIGIASGFLMDIEDVTPGGTIFQPYSTTVRAPFSYVYYAFLAGGILGCIAVMLHRLPQAAHDPARRRKIILGILSALFLFAGAAATFVLSRLGNPYVPAQIGDLIATMGAAFISYDIARHNALNHEQMIESDFWHSLASVTMTVLLCLLGYLALLALFSYQIQPLAVVLISVFIVLTHTPYNWGDAVLDRLFLPRWAVGYRDQLLFMRQQPLAARNPSDSLAAAGRTFDAVLRTTRRAKLEDLIQHEVEEIFKYTNFDSVEVMAESRLLDLQIGQSALQEYAECSHLAPEELSERQRADCLRGLLRSAIDEWPVSPGEPSRRERIEQIILRKKYVEHHSRVDVERLLSDQFDEVITGGGYSRHLKQAREHLAHNLHERELALDGHPQTS